MLALNQVSEPSVGQQIRAIRRRTGLSQADLATKAGLSRSSVARAEKDDETLHPATIARVRAAVEELSRSRTAGATPADAVRGIIESSGETPSDLFREFAARMATRSVSEQWAMAEAFAVTLQMLSGVREGLPGGSRKE